MSSSSVFRVSWTRGDGTPVGRSARLLDRGRLLRFERVTEADGGEYACRAESEAGWREERVMLFVRGRGGGGGGGGEWRKKNSFFV